MKLIQMIYLYGVLGSTPAGSQGSRNGCLFYLHKSNPSAHKKVGSSGRKKERQYLSFSLSVNIYGYFDNTGICLLIDSSREISVSVRATPVIV